MIGPLTSYRWTGLAVVAGMVLLSAGCASLRNYEPTVDPNTLDGTAFLHYLGTVPVASVEEGCRAMLLAADGSDSCTTHEERYAELLRRGFVRDSWRLSPGNVLDKGTLAFMATKVCRLPGGVDSLLLGSWGLSDRRYALKDAVAAGLMSYSTPERAVRGGELLSVLAKVDEYMAEQGLYDWTATEADAPADLPAAMPPATSTSSD